MSQRGAGSRIGSTWTTRAWLTKSSTYDETIGNRWHFGASFAGSMASTSSDAATLSGAGDEVESSMSLATLAGGLGLGYGLYCIVRIDGWDCLYPEVLADGIAPGEFRWEDAALVIDRSARLGPVVEGESHIAKAMDLELRLLDCDSVRRLFGKPTVYAQLTEEYVPGDEVVWLTNPSSFTGQIHIGTSILDAGAVQGKGIAVGEWPEFGELRRYPAGTLVTDTPYTLDGRRVRLYVAAIDPSGRYVQTNNVLDNAAVLFDGYIADRPVRDGTEWVVTVRDQARKLVDPLGLAASGTAVWSPDDDALVDTPTNTVFALHVVLGATTPVSASVQPFTGLSSQVRMSALRQAVIDALTAATTLIGGGAGEVIGYAWRAREAEGTGRLVWDLMIRFNPDTGQTFSAVVYADVQPRAAGFGGLTSSGQSHTFPDTSDEIEHPVGIWQESTVHGVALAVDLDEGDPTLIPETGRIVIEADGVADYAAYTDIEVDPLNGGRVHLQIDAADRPAGQTAIDLLTAAASPSVRFLWTDSGQAKDILRRMIVSTGEGRNGVFDTLPRGYGLGLPNIDSDSFERVFGGGAMGTLAFQIAADSGTSLADLFDGLLRLSRRAIVTRRRADGRSVEIAAVDVGPVDTAVPVITITSRDLALQQGRRPVRGKGTFVAPQAMEIKCRTIPMGDQPAGEGVINTRDPHLVEWTKTRWQIELNGVTRSQVLEAAIAWSTSWYRAGETRQLLEIDVHPRKGLLAQVGDVVELDLPADASLWDYAQGAPGYTGLARVLGAVVSPATMLPTLLVACDGVLTSGGMSPSIPIVSYNGSQTNPTRIFVAAYAEDGTSIYNLLVHARGDANEIVLCVYRPGHDMGRARYVISDITDFGYDDPSTVRLTISSSPTSPVWELTTEDRLTWPPADEGTDEQGEYLHTSDITQWG